MTRFTDVIRGWFGWCPNTNTLRTAPVILTAPSVTADASVPGGGAGGSGRLDRGVNLALGSLRILLANRQLFWFSLLSSLVILFSLVATYTLQFISGINPFHAFDYAMAPLPVLIAQGSPAWLALTFLSQFIVLFCSTYLLAALVYCVSSLLSGTTATLREGLSAVKKHGYPISVWALVYALVATVQSVVVYLYPEDILLILLSGVLFIPFGFVTMFVIPVIVLAGKGLAGAVAESLSLLRKTWGEIILCLVAWLVIWVIVAVAALVPAITIGFPSNNMELIKFTIFLYLLVLMAMIVIYTTAAGIFVTGLYTYAKTGRVPALFAGKPAVAVP
jgi:hypothetical protein